jgi:hypothetical protein
VVVLLLLGTLFAGSLFTTPWLRESRDLLHWGYGPNWKTVAPTLRGLDDECVVMSPWPLHVTYYSGEFPDYILRKKQPEDGVDGTGRLGARTVDLRWLDDADEFGRLVDRHPDVCVIVTNWAFNNDAYLDDAMREAITTRLGEVTHDGDAGVQLYRKPALTEPEAR